MLNDIVIKSGSKPEITIACIGDVMLTEPTFNILRGGKTDSTSKSLWWPLEGIKLVVANLEVPITDSLYIRENKRYNFKSITEILNLFDNRFVLGLANNHILDYGEKGLMDTIDALDKRSIPHAGAGRNINEARKPVIMNVFGTNVGCICAGDPRFQAATKKSAGIFPAKFGLLRESIQEVRKNTEVIVVSIHAGTEFIPVPSPYQLALADLCLKEGVRIVNFHHTHCISGMVDNKKGVVFFGTGNYLFPHNLPTKFRPWEESIVGRITLNSSGQKIINIKVTPIVLNRDGLPVRSTKSQSRMILNRFNNYSKKIQKKKSLGWWRFLEMIQPDYLRLSIIHYFDIYRRQNIKSLLHIIVDSAKTQLTKNPC